MKQRYFSLVLFANIMLASFAQTDNVFVNTSEKYVQSDQRLTIGGYGQVDYNQSLGDLRQNGTLDVHRMVLLLGYKFNSRTTFISELEFEHVKEVYVEQAFLNYEINDFLNFRAGLMLVPMGIINEYHEPTTYNGVERPLIDKYIAPTTWREIGAGFTGYITDASLRYQAYVVNGFNGYDGDPHLSGKNGLRKGRQKGAESYISHPNFTAKVEYFGLPGLNIGVSAYLGKTQSTLYDGLNTDIASDVAMADSSSVGIAMFGADARYVKGGLQLKGQLYFNQLSNTDQYNQMTGSDLGSQMLGYYIEVAYNVLQDTQSKTDLVPFVRYEGYNTHHATAGALSKNDAYNTTAITTGIGWRVAKGAVLKADMQFTKSKSNNEFTSTFNAGVGVWF